MEIQYSLSIDDLIATSNYVFSHSPTTKKELKKQRITQGIVLGLITVMNIFIMIKRFSLPIRLISSDLLLVLLLAFFAYLVYRYFTIAQYMRKRMAKDIIKRYSQGENGEIGDHKCIITDEKVIDITKIDESSSSWAGIEEVVTNDKFLFIIKRGSQSGWSIPKRAFKNDSEFTQFAESANKYFQASQVNQLS
jgi:hypothetical protein